MTVVDHELHAITAPPHPVFGDRSAITHQEKLVAVEHSDFAVGAAELKRRLSDALLSVPEHDIISLSTTHTTACDVCGQAVKHYFTALVIHRYRRRRK